MYDHLTDVEVAFYSYLTKLIDAPASADSHMMDAVYKLFLKLDDLDDIEKEVIYDVISYRKCLNLPIDEKVAKYDTEKNYS